VKVARPNQAIYLGLFYLLVIAASVVSGTSAIFDADAYYYFAIARNVARGAGSTFDGVSVTTGYHPLWLGITTAVHFVFNGVGGFHYAIHAILTVLFIAGHFLLLRVALQVGITFSAFILASLFVLVVNVAIFQSGLENTLLFFLLSLFLWLQHQTWRSKHILLAANALVLMLAYFARLDAIFLVALYLPWYFLKHWRAGHSVAAVTLPTIVLTVIFAHWLFMLMRFGTIYTTSQMSLQEVQNNGTSFLFGWSVTGHTLTLMLQRLFEFAVLDTIFLTGYVGFAAPAGLLLSLFLVAQRNFLSRLPIVMIGLMSILQLAYYVVILDVWTREWYFTGWFILVLFGAASLCSKVTSRLSIVPMGMLILLVLVVILVVNLDRRNESWSLAQQQSELLREYDVPGNILVGRAPDRASYFSGVPIRHLEGKVNGYEYIHSYLLPRRIASYINDIGATHYVFSNGVRPQGHLPCRILLEKDEDGGLVVFGDYERHNETIVVYRISVSSAEATQAPVIGGGECGQAIYSAPGGKSPNPPSSRKFRESAYADVGS